MLSMLLFTVLGFFGPSYWLTLKARRRADLVASELPDALDLLAVSVEAGMGFDGAIAKLTEHMQGPLIDEFQLALGEIRVGDGRPDPLKRVAERGAGRGMAQVVRVDGDAGRRGV